jgi:hypothetical protein
LALEAIFMRSLRTPSLRRHRPSSLGVVTLNGKDHYLGHWPADRKNPPETVRQAYDQLIAEWLAAGRRLQPVAAEQPASISVNELILAFWGHAEQHYRHEDGTPTNELDNLRASLRLLKDLYGTVPAAEFSPLKLKALRHKMIDSRRYLVRFAVKVEEGEKTLERWVREPGFRQTAAGHEALWKNKWRPAELLASEKAMSRGVINQRVGHILRVFRWGVAEELVPETVHRALTALPGLQKGRSGAHKSEGVKPVQLRARDRVAYLESLATNRSAGSHAHRKSCEAGVSMPHPSSRLSTATDGRVAPSAPMMGDTAATSRPPGAPYSTARDARGKLKRIYVDESERYALPGTFDPEQSDAVTVAYLIHILPNDSWARTDAS